MDHIDCIVIGAGVIGLAIARALALDGREVIILEANATVGSETSSRNNEVIHAGFLYPAGSLKAFLCLRGRAALYSYCKQRQIRHRRIGKLLIATSHKEVDILQRLETQALDHDVFDLRRLDRGEVREIEPDLDCLAALHSPSTGILDTHGLLLALLGDAANAGAVIAYQTRASAISIENSRIVVSTTDAASRHYRLACRTLVNAAGLGARELAAQCHAGHTGIVPPVDLAKGSFFTVSGPSPFHHLIVPLAETLAGGGAFTIDTGGQGKFGPDLEWVDGLDYSVDERRKSRFVAVVRRYFPGLAEDSLHPGYAGIRPRLRPPPRTLADWLILGPGEHGVPGLFHLLGFDTPGLTSCLAIGEHVARLTITSRREHAEVRHH